MGLLLNLTLASNSEKFSIDEDDIVTVVSDTLGASVLVKSNQQSIARAFVVSETPAQIAGLSRHVIQLTGLDASTPYLSANKIIDLNDDPGDQGTRVLLDQGGARPQEFIVTESVGEVTRLIHEAAKNPVYDVDAVDQGTKKITLAAAAGDVTGTFELNAILQVVESTDIDKTYTVASSAFAGGKTEVTVSESIPGTTADGKVLIVPKQ